MYALHPSAPTPGTSHCGHQEPLQHDVMDLLALAGALLGLLPQQLAQPHVAEAVLGRHVLALCLFAAAWAAHHEDDRGDLRMSAVPRQEGGRGVGACRGQRAGTKVTVSTA